MSSTNSDQTAETKTSRVYRSLRAQIIDCRLAPGSKLKIAEIAEIAEVSPGAVREALSKLTAEHLVISRNQAGFRVAPISLDDAIDLVATLADIEARAAMMSVRQGDKEWERRLRLAYADLIVGEGMPLHVAGSQSHDRFHEALIGGCGSPWTLRTREMLFRASERYRFFAARFRREADATGPEEVAQSSEAAYAALFIAATSRDPEKTSQLIREHVKLIAKLIEDAFKSEASD